MTKKYPSVSLSQFIPQCRFWGGGDGAWALSWMGRCRAKDIKRPTSPFSPPPSSSVYVCMYQQNVWVVPKAVPLQIVMFERLIHLVACRWSWLILMALVFCGMTMPQFTQLLFRWLCKLFLTFGFCEQCCHHHSYTCLLRTHVHFCFVYVLK